MYKIIGDAVISVLRGSPFRIGCKALLIPFLVVVGLGTDGANGADPPSPTLSGDGVQTLVRATAAKVTPAVVSLGSTVVVQEPWLPGESLPFGLFPERPRRRQYGQGSGVIVSPDGYIITNDHVVAETLEVEVLLADRRQFKGRVVATDPKTDVAVVKIDAQGLPTVPWGDSSALSVGDFVLAIGNPLGLSQTVTFGIVSAVGRADVGVADYEDFIQTDAPINPGSSGGALVNIQGELIGINTAIASMTGGSVGVGFAIPSNMARAALQSLLKTGRVVRGYLGASTQDVTPLLGKLFRLPDVKGAIITDLIPQGSAERAGLRRGDVVVWFDGKEVVDAGRLRNAIAKSAIGSRHRLKIIRDGTPLFTNLEIEEAPRERLRTRQVPSEVEPSVHPLGGLLVDDISFPVARQLGLKPGSGVIVVDVEPSSLAEAAGLFPGDLVIEVNHAPVPDLPAYQRVAKEIKPKEAVLLLINRQGAIVYVPIEGG